MTMTDRPTPRFGDRGDHLLLTPGPLTTSARTRSAMLKDWGSWDGDFRALTAEMRGRLLHLAGADEQYDCVPLQGSGSYAVEAALAMATRCEETVLVLMNGHYGKRAARILELIGRKVVTLDKGDYMPPRADETAEILRQRPDIDTVFLVHCETSSGILNPLAELSQCVRQAGKSLIIDTVSSLGGIPLDLASLQADAIISSSNKCIEGVPGFGFVLARRTMLENAKEHAHSLALDLYDQWDYMNRTGQFRFTPPTHVIAAFLEALRQHEEEGGTSARYQRYAGNRDILVSGLRDLGLVTLLEDEWLSPIITTFLSPDDPAYSFEALYEGMKSRGFIIYPGKLTQAESFRIGCIGQVFAADMQAVVAAVAASFQDMGVTRMLPASIRE